MFNKGIHALLIGSTENTGDTTTTAAAAAEGEVGAGITEEDEEGILEEDVDNEMHPDMPDISLDLDLE